MSTNMRTPLSSRIKSPSRDCSSILRLYWNPEHPPGTTRTRSPEVSGNPSSPAINFLISVAADSVTFSATVGAVVADISFIKSSPNRSLLCALYLVLCTLFCERFVYKELSTKYKDQSRLYLIALCPKRQVRVSSPRSKFAVLLPPTRAETPGPAVNPDG